MREANKRLFLALWPGRSEQEQFHVLAHQHRSADKCRVVAAHRLHLTLCFLGSVDAEMQCCVRQMAEQLVWKPFALNFDRLGWFAGPRVLWVGCLRIPSELKELVGKIQAGLAQCGFEREQRNFQPHITMVRKVTRPPKATEIEPISCYFDRFALVESRMDQHGVEYISLASWPAQNS